MQRSRTQVPPSSEASLGFVDPEEYFTQSPAAMSVTDVDGNIIAVNSAFEAMFGYRREHLWGQHISKLLPASEWGWTLEVRRRILAGELDVFRSTKRYVTAADVDERLEVVVAPVRDPAGNRVGLVTSYDYAMNRNVVDDDSYLQRVLAASQSTLLTMHRDGVVVSTSGRYRDTLGYPADFWNDRPFGDLVIDDDRDRFVEFLATLVDHPDRPIDIELTVRAGDGGERVILMSGTNLLADPAVTAIVVSFQDISELHQRTSDLIEERRIAESVAASRADLIATVSHELRNPLHALQGLAEILATGELPGELAEVAQELYSQLSGLASVTSDLLETARNDRVGIPLNPVPTTLEDLLHRGISYGRASVGTKPVEVVGHLEVNSPAAVMIDQARVDQVIRNLVGNAAKFTEVGSINLTIGPIAQGIHISVSDTGVGIPTAELARVLEPFARGSNSTGASGAGLGLAIVNDLANSMGGRVLVDSRLGRGSTFRVELKAPKSISQPSAATLVDELERFAFNVLVVDDDRTNRLIAARQLERFGCHVVVAQSGEEALDLLAAPAADLPIDVVLMDRRMPGLDGVHTTQRLRDIDHRRDVYVIGLTASASNAERAECAAATMDDFVAKPASLFDLHEAIVRFAARRASPGKDLASANPDHSDTGRSVAGHANPDHANPDHANPGANGIDSAGEGLVDRVRLNELVEEFADVGLVRSLIEMFTEDLPKQVLDIESAHSTANHEVVSRIAHTVKGSAAMLGAQRLRDVAERLEHGAQGLMEEFATVASATVGALRDAARGLGNE